MVAGGGVGMLVLMLIVWALGGNPLALLNQMPRGAPAGQAGPAPAPPEGDEQAEFVEVVLADTEDVWNDLFSRMGEQYVEPKLALFSGGAKTGCGFASSAVGPFYCPADEKVYIDLEFFNELDQRFGASGDFARAYVIAHEVGHHVQHLLGITDKVDAQRGRISEEEMNRLSVRLELQADFLAGVWAHHAQEAKQILEAGDLEEALNAASAIGDDTLQERSQGYVVPDSFTHGTSEQRVRWFRKGFETGDINQGDTFRAREL
jgi:predicted metalloprotease